MSQPAVTTPILSATDRGRRMTVLAPGRSVGRWTPDLIGLVLTAPLLWALASSAPYVALLGLTPGPTTTRALDTPWALAGTVVLALGAATAANCLHRRAVREFGQSRVGGLLVSVTFTAGWAAGAVLWTILAYAHRPLPAFDLDRVVTAPMVPREVGVCLGGLALAWTALTLLRLARVLPHAETRQRTLEGLRRDGSRQPGEITGRTFDNTWLHDQPTFTLEVSYGAPGRRAVVTVFMRTDPDRVPVLGCPVVVLTDGAGAIHVELDEEPRFEQDHRQYAAPAG